ncbi:MAG: protein phosphatase 2C domain-containing protein [Moorea sp. SIO2B7]|nr:protein phosphatase 2C domain-containing protein [Moorena sp. SIO2B7]
MGWKAVAHSAIGTSHQAKEIPCQDYGNFRILNDVIVGAVADGAGSAKYADLGANLAVEKALAYLGGIEEWLQKRKGFWQQNPNPLSEEMARKLFTKLLKKVVKNLHKQAENKGYVINDFACTLLVFVATPEWITAMQIGDGFMVVRPQKGEHQLLFKPDKGEFINETTFVTSENALEEMQVSILSGKQQFICASTDGLERVAIRMSDWAPFPPFFNPLEECLRETDNPQEQDEYVKMFLDSERLNARTNDDKTLLLCLFDL